MNLDGLEKARIFSLLFCLKGDKRKEETCQLKKEKRILSYYKEVGHDKSEAIGRNSSCRRNYQ